MNLKEIKLKESKHLMRFAWGLEITFCIIGLITAYALTMQGIAGSDQNSIWHSSVLVGFIALAAVALVELLKIPTVKAILLANSVAPKIIGFIFLLAVCILTFETMSTGLEQNITNRVHKVTQEKFIIDELNEKILVIEDKISSIENQSDTQVREEIDRGLQITLATINKDINNLRERENDIRNNLNVTEVNELRRQVEALELSKTQTTELHVGYLKQLNNELLQLNKDEQTQLSDSFFKSGVIAKFELRRADIKDEKRALNSAFDENINIINTQINDLNNKIAKLSEPDADTLNELTVIGDDISALIRNKNKLILDANKKSEDQLKIASNNKILIAKLKNDSALLADNLADARNRLALEADKSFIHRLAVKLNANVDHAADLTSADVSKISLFFIASIAAVIAFSGPLITFLAMKNILEIKNPKRATLIPALRKMIIDLRKRLRNPKVITETLEVEVEKEVIKEIPIEKPIYQKVEVPAPYEVVKYVGVPVPKDLSELPEINENSMNGKKVIQGGNAA